VEISERYVDGLASTAELELARREAAQAARKHREAWEPSPGRTLGVPFVVAARAAAAGHASVLVEAVRAANKAARSVPIIVLCSCTSDLLRDIVGNPFHTVEVAPSLFHWENGTLVKIARAIYEERRFQELPILGDALEDAGCNDTRILEHCRQPDEHVLGCWALDLILGKS
jgi:hypothetical protein